MRIQVGSGWLALAAGLAVAASAQAQFNITPGGANAGNGFYRNAAIGTSATGTGPASAEFRATTSTSPDQMFQDWWWFRGPGDTREYAFANQAVTGGPTISGTLQGNTTNTLDTGGYDFNVTGGAAGGVTYSFRSIQRWQINAGAFGPSVNVTNQITNTGNGPAQFSLFYYQDFDANASAGTDTWSFVGNGFLISDGPVSILTTANGFTNYQSTAYSTLRGLLSNTAVNSFNNTNAGSPGDFTGGFQWDITLAAGQSVTLGGNFAFVPAPSAVALLGLGGLAAARRRRS